MRLFKVGSLLGGDQDLTLDDGRVHALILELLDQVLSRVDVILRCLEQF